MLLVESVVEGPDELTMEMLYDSEDFVLVHISLQRKEGLLDHWFEIARKKDATSVTLQGAMSQALRDKIAKWKVDAPTAAEVEHTLDGYTQLGAWPLTMH